MEFLLKYEPLYNYMKIQLNNKKSHNGYVALMASVVISVVLLLLSTEAALLGWSTRFAILANESLESSIHLAHSCAELSVGKFLQNPNYRGSEVLNFKAGICEVSPFIINEVSEKIVTMKVRAVVDQVVIIHEYVYKMTDIHIDEPLSSQILVSSNSEPSLSLVSWREMYVEP